MDLKSSWWPVQISLHHLKNITIITYVKRIYGLVTFIIDHKILKKNQFSSRTLLHLSFSHQSCRRCRSICERHLKNSCKGNNYQPFLPPTSAERWELSGFPRQATKDLHKNLLFQTKVYNLWTFTPLDLYREVKILHNLNTNFTKITILK